MHPRSNSDARDEMENIELLNEVKSVDYGKAEMSKEQESNIFGSKCPGSAKFKPLLESNGRDWKKFSKHTPPKQWEPGPRLHRGVLPTRTTGSTHMKISQEVLVGDSEGTLGDQEQAPEDSMFCCKRCGKRKRKWWSGQKIAPGEKEDTQKRRGSLDMDADEDLGGHVATTRLFVSSYDRI